MNLPSTPPDLDTTPMGLFRLSAAARAAGISPELFVTGVNAGNIPCEIISIGPRVKFVRATELGAWLYGKQKNSQFSGA